MDDDKQIMNFDYLRQGSRTVETTSSFLVSSSKYLNNATLRDWMTTHFLRRNGVDRPTPADATLGLIQAMEQIRDVDHVLSLIEREKELNPKFKTWIEARFLSEMTKKDFAKYKANTFGGAYYKYLSDFGLEINVGSTVAAPKTDIDYVFSRVVQTHDLIHLVTGAQFNSLGEIIPAFAQLSNMHQHMTAELAQFFCEYYIFIGTRFEMRACLHYPSTWMTVMDMMRRAISIGFASECFLMMPYEEALHLPIPEARAKLGVRNAEDIDSAREDEVYTEQRPATRAELLQIGRSDLARVRI
jgi:ubiquinone biosynthesis protein Coq4